MAIAAGVPMAAWAWPEIELAPILDNTLYETAINSGEVLNEVSNGIGIFMFSGRAGLDTGFKLRRALFQFDLSSVPAGAEILAAELTVYQSKAAPGAPPASMGLYRVLQAWGEGTSDGIGPEGQGNFATEGDATWHHRLFPDTLWATAGGSFAASPSASVTVGEELTHHTWTCTAGMVADLVQWQAQPETNFGWIIVGGEEAGFSAHRFGTRENPAAEERPSLRITYRPAGSVLIDGFEDPPDCD